VCNVGVRFSASGILFGDAPGDERRSGHLRHRLARERRGWERYQPDITLTNNGPATALTNTVRATLPPGLTFKSAAGGTFDAGLTP
jgi:hypothetical protein